jgi:replicative DNA helicase
MEAETSVLGSILLSERAMYALVVEEGLKPEDFYRERHRVIYAAMLRLYRESEPIDVLTVTERLKADGEGEAAATVDELTAGVPAAGNVRQYARIVREHALLRRMLNATYDIQAAVSERRAAPRELVEQAERAMLEVAHDDRQKDFRSIEEVLHDELDKLHRLSVEGTALTGTPSGFKDLDEITGGFQPGNLIIIAARPSMGKSALVTNIAENASIDYGKAVALFSLEMSETELAQRFVASQARVKGEELRKGRVAEHRWAKIVEASQRLANAPLFIDDSSDVGMLEIRAKARRLHQQHELGLVIVDYLQLMRPDHTIESRVQQVGEMSRGLKILARELNVPVIALSQLSRAVESRTDKRPILSDLRESGQIEQDADLVAFIYREEYYDNHRQAPQRRARRRRADVREGVPEVPQLRRGPVRGMSDCPFDLCDGSGFLVDEATNTARDCRCRAGRVSRARARSLSGVIPRRYRLVSFDAPPVSDLPAPQVRVVRDFARRIDDHLDAGRGLWLFGGVGTGKTTLAMLVSRHALEAGRSVAIYSLPRLLAELRRTFDDGSEHSYTELLDRLAAVDLLHIDDVGAEQTSPWVLEQLYALINARYEDERSVIVTTNIEEREELVAQIGERTVSRLQEMCELIPLFGDDARSTYQAHRPVERAS